MPDTNTTKHTPHELDVLIVANPDVGCDFQDPEWDYNHKDYFEWRWDGKPHRVAPGKTRRMPRFLAEHFAKHLADHILMMREEETGKKGLMQSPVERPKVLNQIILGVDEWFLGEEQISDGDKIARDVDKLNPDEPEERALDLGKVEDPMLGVLKAEPKSLTDIMKAAGEATAPEQEVLSPKVTVELTPKVEETPKVPETLKTPTTLDEALPDTKKVSINDENKPRPTRKELITEADKLGIELTGKETVDQLIGKIKAF